MGGLGREEGKEMKKGGNDREEGEGGGGNANEGKGEGEWTGEERGSQERGMRGERGERLVGGG